MAGAKEIKTKIASVQSTQKLLRQWKWWQPRKCVKRKIVWLLLVRILKQYEMLSATSLKQLLVINTHFNSTRSKKSRDLSGLD